MDTLMILAVVSLAAASVTGALGYGYSSITVPLALLVMSSRTLNPALVIIEVVVNAYAVYLNRHAVRRVLPRVVPVVIGLVPGVVVGALLLAAMPAGTVKVVCYGALLPLIMAQAAGARLPFGRGRGAMPVGLTLGALYSLTTISGPPLAMYFNSQGLARSDFKVALAVTRLAQGLMAVAAYAALGLFVRPSFEVAAWLAPGVLIGMPLGHVLLSRIKPETFRRVCMSFDVWLIGFGMARALVGAHVLPPLLAYQVLVFAVGFDAILLRRYFGARRDAQLAQVAAQVAV